MSNVMLFPGESVIGYASPRPIRGIAVVLCPIADVRVVMASGETPQRPFALDLENYGCRCVIESMIHASRRTKYSSCYSTTR
jgi:hypothetical protein